MITRALTDAGISSSDFSMLLAGNYPLIDFALQYDESPLAFVSRLMEEEGIWFYATETPTASELVFGDSTFSYGSGGSGTYAGHLSGPSAASDRFTSLAALDRYFTGQVRVRGFNLADPAVTIEATDFPSSTGGVAEGTLDGYSVARGSSLQASMRASVLARQAAVGASALAGTSNLVDLRAGHTFGVADTTGSGFAGPRVATRVDHVLLYDAARACLGYANAFEAVPSSVVYQPARVTPRPSVPALQTAIVTGPSGQTTYTDSLGRVKVRFLWDRSGVTDETSSGWVRVGLPIGALDTYLTPEIGDEVLVGFQQGDDRAPVILGTLWNGAKPPPTAP